MQAELKGVMDRVKGLPWVFLLTFCLSLEFYLTNRWCVQRRPPLSQLHPVSVGRKKLPLRLKFRMWRRTGNGSKRKSGSLPPPISLYEWPSQTLLVDAGLPPALKTFPFSHMLLMLRIPSVTIGRSMAADLGDLTSLLLWPERARQKGKAEISLCCLLVSCV